MKNFLSLQYTFASLCIRHSVASIGFRCKTLCSRRIVMVYLPLVIEWTLSMCFKF